MYVCIVTHIAKSMDQPGKVANPTRGQLNRETCPRSRLRIWSRETASAVPSRTVPRRLQFQLEHRNTEKDHTMIILDGAKGSKCTIQT